MAEAIVVALSIACGRGDETHSGPSIDAEVIDTTVVEHVAARDDVDPARARERVVETLRLVAAARADGAGELAEPRREHLRRTALARVVLHDDFEGRHRAEDIPADAPLMLRARAEPRFVHPVLHHTCQLIAVPPGKLEGDALTEATADPAWRARALARMRDVRRHVEAIVPLDDADACTLLLRDTELERDPDDDGAIVLRAEGAMGFDLDACATELGPDGRCDSPRLDTDWVNAVREGPVPGLRGPFATRFGVHVVLVREVLPAALADREGFDAEIRAQVLPAWSAAALGEWLSSLRTRHAALVAVGGE